MAFSDVTPSKSFTAEREGSPIPFKRSATRVAISTGVEDEISDDNKAKNMKTAQSFKSLMTVPTTDAEKKSLRERYNSQADGFRRQIRRQRRCTLDPNGRWMSKWDIVTSLALLFTATVTPYEVCILESLSLSEMLVDPLAWVNRVVDAIFIVDVCFQCFTCYQDTTDNGGSSWVYNNRRIFCHYARTWMPLDVITGIPIDLITASVAGDSDRASDSAEASALQLVRMIRLVKLGRILRASRIFKRWEAYLGISYSLITLVKFFLLVAFLAHWMACFWVLVGRSSIHTLEDGVNGASYADPHAAFGQNWVHRANLQDATPRQLYSVALFVALSSIFSGATGAVQPASPSEYYITSAMMVLGSSVWAYVISNAVAIFATLNPNGVHYRHMMDELNYFARDKKLPKTMLIKLREFFGQTQQVHRQARYDVLLDNMSARLKADAALCWANATLMRVPYFTVGGRFPIEDEFLASAALTLKTKIFCRSEYIPVECLSVVERGIAAKNGRIQTKGSCLGQDMVLNSPTFRDLDPAIALTFVVQVETMEKKHLEELMKEFPLARKKIRIATYQLAFVRAMVSIAQVCVQQMRTSGARINMIEALERVRSERIHALPQRMYEPTKRVLANTLSSLSERVEATHEETREGLAALQTSLHASLDAQLSALRTDLFARIDAATSPGTRAGSPNRPTFGRRKLRTRSKEALAAAMENGVISRPSAEATGMGRPSRPSTESMASCSSLEQEAAAHARALAAVPEGSAVTMPAAGAHASSGSVLARAGAQRGAFTSASRRRRSADHALEIKLPSARCSDSDAVRQEHLDA